MAGAQGSRTQLTYVVESTFGTTPSTPTMIDIPKTGFNLGLNKSVLESNDIRSDRQVAVSRHGNKRVSGDINVEFRADDYDDLLESALFGTFTSNVLKLGTTPQYMTFEDGMLDTGDYLVYTGCAVNTFSMDVQPDQIVTATFGLVGKTMTTGTTALDGTPQAASGNAPFDSFSGTITENSISIAVVTGINFTVENSLAPAFVIGSDSAQFLESGRGRVSGEMTLFFEDLTLLNKFVNETESDLTFSLTDGLTGNTYTFDFPKIKYNGGNMPLDSEQSRVLTMPFQALYNAADNTSLSITKS